ncbi:NUDIX hydrolase [Stomatohabitans albus]|uniref:NUDIX hydrolase n=1 Tax=Stomatohabitans albus TaxID=3110766 RepID=UPI00300D920C
MTPVDTLPLLLPHLSTATRIICMDEAAATVLDERLPQTEVFSMDPARYNGAPVDACLLLDGDVAARGVQGPVLIAKAIDTTRPGGLIAALVPSQRFTQASGKAGGMLAETLHHAMAERGLDVFTMLAPGAGANLGGRPYAGYDDITIDRTPGLLDAGPFILALAHTWKGSDERSANFFASLPMRVAAASAICFHPVTGELLCVYDNFKQGWTLPGGVVDKHESPEEGAIRECFEEAGVAVEVTAFAGLFTHSNPERLHFLYFASPVGQHWEHPQTAHPHEIDDVAWFSLDEANKKLNAYMWHKVATCLDVPGKTWPFDPNQQ